MQHVKRRNDIPSSLLKRKEKFLKDCGENDAWEFYRKNESEYDYRTSEVKELLLKASDNRCAICSRNIYDANCLDKNNKNISNVFTIEHVIPKRRNPGLIFEWSNMIPCCVACNNSRDDKEYNEELYIDPCANNDFVEFICFSYDGSIYCSDPKYINQTNYMIQLYNLNGNSKRKGIKAERRRYYKLLIDDDYQKIVELNKEFGLSDNIIIFKDMFLFNERSIKYE